MRSSGMRRPSLRIAALALGTLVLVAPACAAREDRLVLDDPPEPDDAPGEAKSKPNLPIRTLGGRQFWADVDWFAGWRIQEHVWTGHHRLLDPILTILAADGERFELPGEVDEILNHTVGPTSYHRDDAVRRRIVEHFELNLARMVHLARSCGARVWVPRRRRFLYHERADAIDG